MIKIDLNKDNGRYNIKIKNNNITDKNISIYFKDLEIELVNKIKSAEYIFGCIAWLTNYKILNALIKKATKVSIVVQKEDFLKPDINSEFNWKDKLQNKYKQIGNLDIARISFNSILNDMSTLGDWTVNGIRCVGNYNRDRDPSFPRMHNKFMVFSRYNGDIGFIPYAVWTGSFNFSYCGELSFENAVYIENEKIAKAYFEEYSQIMCLSEPLNWDNDWISPEWRLGT